MMQTLRFIGSRLRRPRGICLPLIVCVGPFLASPWFAKRTHAQSADSTDIAIENVTVVDVVNGGLSHGMTVAIHGPWITDVAPAAQVRLHGDARRINGSGKYLIPGLWDMHVHMATGFMELYLANGVTGVRQMWSDPLQAEANLERIRRGDRVGVRGFVTGEPVDGPRRFGTSVNEATTPEAGRTIVDSLAAVNASFVKVSSQLQPDVFRAIMGRAHEFGMPVAGHVPFAVTASEASDLGMASMEHLMGVVEGCSRFEEDIRAARAVWLAEPASVEQQYSLFFDPGMYRQVVEGYDEKLCTRLLDQLSQNGTWQVPTLVAIRAVTFMDDSAFTADTRLVYMPKWAKRSWQMASMGFWYRRSDDDRAAAHAYFNLHLKITGLAAARGVPILPGTDSGISYTFPGFSLQDELGFLVKAGLTPHQVLRAATYDPAVFFQATDSLGTVEAGKLADLVLLDADPLEDIANTQRIAAVVANGRLYDRPTLDEWLATLKKRAAAVSIADAIRPLIDEQGVEAGIARYWELKGTDPDAYSFEERELNSLGYGYLQAGKTDIALELFKLNVEVYPEAYNTYDSLAEAYMMAGQMELSIQNYTRSLELNPENDNAREKLRSLGVDPEQTSGGLDPN